MDIILNRIKLNKKTVGITGGFLITKLSVKVK
jgi:hypothetical protein